MKVLTAGLKSHIAQQLTTLVTCWKITRRDATVFGFTDHISDLTVSSQLYKASTGYTASKIETIAGLNVDNLELQGAVHVDSITEEDVLAGLWDFAEVEIFQVNYKDLSQGTLKLRKGNVGEIRIRDGIFVAELRGMLQPLQQNIGRTYQAGCNADLFDSRCGLSAASFTSNGSVSSVTSRRLFADVLLGAPATGYFAGGLLTWVTGENAGLSMEVKASTTSTGAFELFLPMPYDISIGDTFTVRAGCDKTIATCLAKFNNVVNFRGFPHVPGLDNLASGTGA